MEVVPTVGGAGRRGKDSGGGRALDAPADAGAEVGGKPTVAAGTGATADEVGRWDRGGTPSGTWEEHCRMELLRPSSSLSPCVRGSHRLR
jgi:hypothetical protein